MAHMFFCENCNDLTEEKICSECGKATRIPEDDDTCLFGDFCELTKSMFTDALDNNEIEYLAVPVFGGYSQLNTPNSYKFYVKYKFYEQAQEIFDSIWGRGDNKTLNDEDWIDRIVKVIIDRPKGSVHPEHPNIVYELNYGHVEDIEGYDGEELDAYLLDWNADNLSYVGKDVNGFVAAVIRRKNDEEIKLVVVTDTRKQYTKEQIAKAVDFQEKFFDIEIIM